MEKGKRADRRSVEPRREIVRSRDPDFNIRQALEKNYGKVAKRRVALVGAGGINSNLAFFLAGNGVKHFSIIDGDKINSRNVLLSSPYYQQDCGRYKAEVLAGRLPLKNKSIEVSAYTSWDFDVPENVFKDADLIVLGVDSNEARRRVNDFNIGWKKPIVNIGFHGWEGAYLLIIPGTTACWSCLFRPKNEEEERQMNEVHSCPKPEPNVPGGVVMGTIAMLCGLASAEIMKYFAGTGDLLQYYSFDTMTRQSVSRFLRSNNYLKPDRDCPACGRISRKEVSIDIGKL